MNELVYFLFNKIIFNLQKQSKMGFFNNAQV